MSRISYKTKLKQGRGTGDGKDYKPFIKTREINSMGTCSNIVDWKTGRQMQLLSQTEMAIFMQLRWDDNVDEIKEQFPLDLEKVTEIIKRTNDELRANNQSPLSIRYDKQHWPTTNMVVYKNHVISKAVSVKYDKSNLSAKEIESLWIKKKYWAEQGVPVKLMDRHDVNPILVQNLRLVTEYYDYNRVFDRESLLKHLIATKQIHIDMTTEVLDFRKLLIEEKI